MYDMYGMYTNMFTLCVICVYRNMYIHIYIYMCVHILM